MVKMMKTDLSSQNRNDNLINLNKPLECTPHHDFTVKSMDDGTDFTILACTPIKKQVKKRILDT